MRNRTVLFLIAAFALNVHAEDARIVPYRDHGAQVHWSPGGDRIAYATKGKDGFYGIHIARPDGTHDACITDLNTQLPKKHMGAPAWHPSEKWLVFVAEKSAHPGGSFEAIPGFGGYSDVWVMTPDGKSAFALTHLPLDADHGVLIPRFSPDGKRVLWTERTEKPEMFSLHKSFGYWVIKVADFVVESGVHSG